MGRIQPRRWAVVLGVLSVLALGGLAWGATRPRVANHFGYALPGRDGLPTYIYTIGRRYHSSQVCADGDWCQADREQQNIPRCYTQADLQTFHAWPLSQTGTMFTLFGAPQPIYNPTAEGSGSTVPFIMADGPNCYVVYDLEGGP